MRKSHGEPWNRAPEQPRGPAYVITSTDRQSTRHARSRPSPVARTLWFRSVRPGQTLAVAALSPPGGHTAGTGAASRARPGRLLSSFPRPGGSYTRVRYARTPAHPYRRASCPVAAGQPPPADPGPGACVPRAAGVGVRFPTLPGLNIFRITGLTKVFGICRTVDQAIAARK
jgi:hypothetical protein